MSDVVVTGSSENLGQWVVGTLILAGWRATFLDHAHPGRELPVGVTAIETDLTDAGETLETILAPTNRARVHPAEHHRRTGVGPVGPQAGVVD
jgi:nucleoside-diphosphate-sugar epimerase